MSSLGVGWRAALTQPRLQGITEELNAEDRINSRLLFLKRTPVVAATSREIMGKFKGEVYAADIIMDDQEAVVHDYGRFSFQSGSIANLKHGYMITQEDIEDLEYIIATSGAGSDFARGWIMRRQANLIMGIQHRLEALIVSCLRDSTVYDRYGVKVRGTWGMPQELKMLSAAPWSDLEESTPVSDLQYLANEVAPDMETEFTRATLSRQAFGLLLKSKEFQAKSKFVMKWDVPDDAFPSPFDPRMVSMAESVVGLKFELYDATMKVKNADGSAAKTRILPQNEIILSSPAIDNNAQVIDIGNAAVTESLLNEYAGASVIGGIPNRMAGPVAFAAATSIDANPPGLSSWAVQRCFPRKWDENATGLLNIGTVDED